ncbi:hypothetical protein TNCV_546281 [Trichonephila clavipes]|nr:hypothetical protein TNCV_546281 [Trichonephila clavipes]
MLKSARKRFRFYWSLTSDKRLDSSRPAVTCSRVSQNLCRFQCQHVPQSPVQSLPEPMQLFPELDMLDPLESTMHLTSSMSFVAWTPRTQVCFTRYPLFLMRISSFLDEREPMD